MRTVAGDPLAGPAVPDDPPDVASGAREALPAARQGGGEATGPERTGAPQGAASVSSSSAGPSRAGGACTRPDVPGVPPGPPAGRDDADHSDIRTDSLGVPVSVAASVPTYTITAYHTGPLHQEPAMLATVRPDQRDQPGCAGHAAALDHLVGVVDGSCVELPLLGNNGNPPTRVNRHSSALSPNVTHTVDTPWSSLVWPSQCLSNTGIHSPGLGTL